MDHVLQEQTTAFRYSLIAPIVSRQTPMVGIARSPAKRYVNLLVLLGFVKKLHHANVPKTLFKRLEQDKRAVNYYCLSLFDDVANEAENMAKKIKELKFKKAEIDFEYIAAAFGLDKAREVFPNDMVVQPVQPVTATTKRKVRKKVEGALGFMEQYAKAPRVSKVPPYPLAADQDQPERVQAARR